MTGRAILPTNHMGTTTLQERIEWILEHRSLAQRALARAAGLSNGYVSALMTRLRKDPTGTLDVPAARSIATAGKVSLHWLLTGEGQPEEVSDDRYLPLAQRRGWPEELAQAKAARPPGIAERYLDEAGAWVVPTRDMSAHLITKIAETLSQTDVGANRSDKRGG